MSFNELLNIHDNELAKIQTPIEQEALSDSVEIAISKKIDKMKGINEADHEWFTYWLIVHKDNHKGIGFIGFKRKPDGNGYSEIGYSISSNYRMQGLMTETLSLMIGWASKLPACWRNWGWS